MYSKEQETVVRLDNLQLIQQTDIRILPKMKTIIDHLEDHDKSEQTCPFLPLPGSPERPFLKASPPLTCEQTDMLPDLKVWRQIDVTFYRGKQHIE